MEPLLMINAALLLSRLMQFATAAPPPRTCSDVLVTFTTCLPYVSVSPNNLTDSPTPQCCDDISAAFSTGSSLCICYFLLRPGILGFPLNSTKLMSLTSVCPRHSKANFSLQTLCSESTVLPPLQTVTGANVSPPSPPSVDSPEESPIGSPSPPEADSDGLLAQPTSSPTAILPFGAEGFRNFDPIKTWPINLIFFICILDLM